MWSPNVSRVEELARDGDRIWQDKDWLQLYLGEA